MNSFYTVFVTYLLFSASQVTFSAKFGLKYDRDSRKSIQFPDQYPRNQALRGDKPNPQDNNKFLEWLLGGPGIGQADVFQTYDGWFNNKDRPELGAAGSPLSRNVPAKYQDPKSKPYTSGRPNPFTLSDLLAAEEGSTYSRAGKSSLLVFFGEHVTNEIVDTRSSACPPEYFNIQIPENHEFRTKLGHSYLPFKRAAYSPKTGESINNPRKLINTVTPWIDGGSIYGRSKFIADQLRAFDRGKLLSLENGNFPPLNFKNLPIDNQPVHGINSTQLLPVDRLRATGDSHANENPLLLAISIMWNRWHNILAEKLLDLNPHWSDEKIFLEARKWVIATQQQIIANEWLPLWTGKPLQPYGGYNQALDPSVSHIFAGAAMRYGHTLVPSIIKYWKSSCVPRNQQKRFPKPSKSQAGSLRLCNSYFKSFNYSRDDYTALVMGMTLQSARSDGMFISNDLRTRTYGPLDFTRRDLAAVNIQRGRDAGLGDYIAVRKAMNLPVYSSFDEIFRNLWNSSRDQEKLKEKLEKLYRSVNDTDLWLGGILESSQYGMGQLFQRIILEQFERIRNSDYFWFQNPDNKLFDQDQIRRLESISIRDILMVTLKIDDLSLQNQPFLLPNKAENPLPDCAPRDLIEFTCGKGSTCFSLPMEPDRESETCVSPRTFDYLLGSEYYFIGTLIVLGLYIIVCWAVFYCLVARRKHQDDLDRKRSKKAKMAIPQDENTTITCEWNGDHDDLKPILVQFEMPDKRISIRSIGPDRKLIRRIDLRNMLSVTLQVSVNPKNPFVLIKFPNEHDLIIKLDSEEEQKKFTEKLESFLGHVGVGRERRELDYKRILKGAYTKQQRHKHLESFFRAVFAHAFDIKPLKGKVDIKIAKDILKTELTQYEFAEALAMRPDSLFVKQMFALVDKDENGYISFREFLDMMIIFAKGSADQKAKLMFDMYDLDGTGSLSKEEFSTMIRSMLELANQSIEASQMEQLINTMFQSAGFNSKNELTLTDFLKFLGDYKDEFGYVELNLEVGDLSKQIEGSSKRQSALVRARDKVVRAYSLYSDSLETSEPEQRRDDQTMHIKTMEPTPRSGPLNRLARFIDERKWHIFFFMVFLLTLSYIFADKVIYFAYFNEQRGLRQIAGSGVALTRGSASVMMFTFSLVLLTMSRNIITFLRETFLHKYIPFDASVSFHKIVAIIGLIFSAVHSIGHFINFYSIITQRPDDLACLFPNFHARSHELPKFQDWCFFTITGITGLLLVALMVVIYIFATPVSRRHVFNTFWATHNLYPIFYFLMFLHGLGRLVQEPLFYQYMALPLILFKIDRLISISRKKVQIPVVQAILYPSDVTMIQLKKPANFELKSGQWVRIACTGLNPNEYHPFTLASAPHEENLQLFIRAVGPFTKNIRKIYDSDSLRHSPYPKMFLDGPYGETHQDWFRYPVSILVGGGIGVTPFASILKDIAFRASTNKLITCRKVYFLWVTRTQKHFEWLVDILRDLEEKDTSNLVQVHIFITQFYDKFDLRTMMLYVCERHFQRISNRSLFTGLKAKTQFGRPNFAQFFGHLQRIYTKVDRIGVFSCGPAPMTNGVGNACEALNRRRGALFIHHSENF